MTDLIYIDCDGRATVFSLHGPKCPRCGAEWVCDEAFYYNEVGYTLECDACGVQLIVQPQVEWSWTSIVAKDES